MLLHTITQSPLLHVARPSQSTRVLLCPSTRSSLRHRARNLSRHHQTTLLSSRHHHDYPAGHPPRAGEPHLPAPPPPVSTVNDAEISHFSRLSALWWDERGEFALLHKMNPHRIRFIREKVLEVLDATSTATSTPVPPSLDSPRVLEGMDVLDIGCGGGILSEVCSSCHFEIFLVYLLMNGCRRSILE